MSKKEIGKIKSPLDLITISGSKNEIMRIYDRWEYIRTQVLIYQSYRKLILTDGYELNYFW